MDQELIEQLSKRMSEKIKTRINEECGEILTDARIAIEFVKAWQTTYEEVLKKADNPKYKKLKLNPLEFKAYSIQDIMDTYNTCKQAVMYEYILTNKQEV